MAERCLISRRDKSVPPPNKIDQEIASAINRALLQQRAPALIRIMNAKRTARGTIPAVTHQNAMVATALLSCDVIITMARTVVHGVIDVEDEESWERLKIHAVRLIWYMGQGTESLQKMPEECEVENQGIGIPTQVRWLANPHTIRKMRQNRQIAASWIVFVVLGARRHRM